MSEEVTHQMHEACCSATLTLFREGGYRCQFTFRQPYENATDNFGNYVAVHLEELAAAGWQPTEPGLEPGEQTEDVGGWVLGSKSDGSPVVWIYGHPALQWKIDTVWEENIPNLPFDTSAAKQWPTNQAPEQDQAKQQGFWNEFKARVVMEDHPYRTHQSGKLEGQPFKVISRWIGHEPAATEDEDKTGWPELYESTAAEACEENWHRWLDTRGTDIRNRAAAMVKLAKTWCQNATTTAHLDAIENAVESAVAAKCLRDVSRQPLLDMVAEKRKTLPKTEEIPV